MNRKKNDNGTTKYNVSQKKSPAIKVGHIFMLKWKAYQKSNLMMSLTFTLSRLTNHLDQATNKTLSIIISDITNVTFYNTCQSLLTSRSWSGSWCDCWSWHYDKNTKISKQTQNTNNNKEALFVIKAQFSWNPKTITT